MTFIKVLDSLKAENLKKQGFKYTLENYNGETIYIFIATDELLKHVNKNFAKTDYFISRTICF